MIVEEQADGEEGRSDGIVRHELDISSKELKVCQATDPSLRSVRIAVKTHETKEGTGFFSRDGLLTGDGYHQVAMGRRWRWNN